MTARLLADTVEAFGPAPRKLSFTPRRLTRMHGVTAHHSLGTSYDRFEWLLREGTITLAGIASVATALLGPGDLDGLATVLFVPPWLGEVGVSHLLRLSGAVGAATDRGGLGSLAGTPTLQKVGPPYDGGEPLHVTTLHVQRAALPRRRVEASWLPVVVHPDSVGVIPLPLPAWSPSLVDAYRAWGGF